MSAPNIRFYFLVFSIAISSSEKRLLFFVLLVNAFCDWWYISKTYTVKFVILSHFYPLISKIFLVLTWIPS